MANPRVKQLAPSSAAADQVVTFDGTHWIPANPVGVKITQEQLTAENITGTDTALADTLADVPVTPSGVVLFLNGVHQSQGSGKDYSISGQTITWLASSGTAKDMLSTDDLTAFYFVNGPSGALTLTDTKTANYTALVGQRVLYDPSGGTFTITAPASPATGDSFGVLNTTTDITQVTIDGNSNDIVDPVAEDFASTTFLMGLSLTSLVWVYDGTNWLLV